MHTLIFYEPICYDKEVEYVEFSIGDEMYQSVLDGPIEIFSDDGDNNAYIFGTVYLFRDYEHLGWHGNDCAMTGFIDKDLVGDWETRDSVLERYMGCDINQKLVRKVRRKEPFILWFGETYGGDVGASLYCHRDTNGEIDSLLVDIHYFEE